MYEEAAENAAIELYVPHSASKLAQNSAMYTCHNIALQSRRYTLRIGGGENLFIFIFLFISQFILQTFVESTFELRGHLMHLSVPTWCYLHTKHDSDAGRGVDKVSCACPSSP